MDKVTFKNENIILEVEPGTLLSECIRISKHSLETPCNCMGLCGKCLVKATGDLEEASAEEKAFLKNQEGIRLACLAKVKGDVIIELINRGRALKTINRGFNIEVEVDSEIKKVSLPRVDKTSAEPYEELLYKSGVLTKEIDELTMLEKIAEYEKSEPEEIQGVTYNGNLLDIDLKIDKLLGAAVDIGTTGVSAYLIDLENGEVLNKISCLNPQTEFGGDVLSRITYAVNNKNGTKDLKDSIIKKINEMISDLISDLTDPNYCLKNVYRVIIAANTTMLHLFAGINPQSIAKAPYRAVFLNKRDIRALDMGININPQGFITLLPSASSYVGADIVSGVAATDFYKKKHSSIFIDIGTNGEIVVISEGRLAATSTAAGPALEGMNISCGCRAEEGAIDAFNIDEEFNISYTTIGDVKAKGICGSGLIDVAAALVKGSVVMASGKFNHNLPEQLRSRLVDKKFYITEEIFISQKDIRQIQLAKGAIAAGVSMLLKELNVSINEVKETVIGGAFGYHINPESIKTIGLIPKGFKGYINFVGNSSVEGARLALINRTIIKKMEELKDAIEVIELSIKDEFQGYFVEALGF